MHRGLEILPALRSKGDPPTLHAYCFLPDQNTKRQKMGELKEDCVIEIRLRHQYQNERIFSKAILYSVVDSLDDWESFYVNELLGDLIHNNFFLRYQHTKVYQPKLSLS